MLIMDEQKNLLIVNGITLAQTGSTPPFNGNSNMEENKYKRDISQARDHILPQIVGLTREVEARQSDDFLSEIYFKVNYPKTFLAKSYQVESIYRGAGLKLIGSASWIDNNDEFGKSDFLLGSRDSIESFTDLVRNTTVQVQQKEIRRMEEISLLNPTFAVEGSEDTENVYELRFHEVKDIDELIERFINITHIDIDEITVRQTEDRTVFIVCRLTADVIHRLRTFNPLRSLYSANNREILAQGESLEQVRNNYKEVSLSQDEMRKLPWIGMIDGGVSKLNGFFATVEQVHEASEPANGEFMEHGSSVASVILYGDLSEDVDEILRPSFRIQSIRALPSESDIEFNLLTLDRMIAEIIPKYENIKVWNLSIGPVGPVQDEVVSSLTQLLDEVAYKYDVIFVIAAGNTGDQNGVGRRIQIPADSVNNITVAAYYNHNGKRDVAPYNSVGLGREGGKLKPDLIDHGGLLPLDPVYTISSYAYALNKMHGTSFAAPHIARKLALILNDYPNFSVWEARALLEHSIALRITDLKAIQYESKGEFSGGTSQLIASLPDEVRIMYSGEISAKSYLILPIPLPDNTIARKAQITWTIVTKSKVNPNNTDRYTEYGIEDAFYPDAEKYPFTKTGETTVQVNLASDEGIAQAEILLAQGFKQSVYPKREPTKYMDETERRNELLKWDTTKTQRIGKMVSSLNNPFIRLHGLSRSDNRDRINYSVIVTVKLINDVNIYQNVLTRYKSLQPVQTQSENRLQV